MRLKFWSQVVFLATAVAVLTGCASVRRIDSDVSSVAAAPAGVVLQGARYRFERLPSQANNPQVGLAEQQAQEAMTAVGLVRSDADAQLSVLVASVQSLYRADAWGRPVPINAGPGWAPFFGHISIGNSGHVGRGSGTRAGASVGVGFPFPPPVHYRREVSLVFRDLRSGQVVYETRASHDGPWSDDGPVFSTLFQAAMSHFPNPPPGPRRVFIDLPR
jgi:hypothetical protein